MRKKKPEIVCIDFDGTLHDYKNPVPGRKMGPPTEGALAAVEEIQDRGHKVVVLTVNNIQVVSDWLEFYGFEDIEVTHEKPNALAYIDDRAVRFDGNWLSTLHQLNVVTGYQEED